MDKAQEANQADTNPRKPFEALVNAIPIACSGQWKKKKDCNQYNYGPNAAMKKKIVHTHPLVQGPPEAIAPAKTNHTGKQEDKRHHEHLLAD
ncbi:MAG: hypothetical protein ACKODW_04380 [Methylophilaceae bacterium]